MLNILQFFSRYQRFIFMLPMICLLVSCGHVHRQDGPPPFPVNEKLIPNAVPKVEPLSKYGNMRFYHVFGKRYYPMRSSKRYDEVGIASWYGTKFHAQRTSSGEAYNMLAMTAAHKTLPLPTYVEVTNLRNQKKIIVKVNDRGPFEANRLIDLSYVAAKKLGMIGHGTAVVRVKAIDPSALQHPLFAAHKRLKSESRNLWANTTKVRHLFLQVGAFHQKKSALSLRQKLRSLIKAPVKISAQPKGGLYLVAVGPIKDDKIAKRLIQQLQSLGFKTNKIYGA